MKVRRGVPFVSVGGAVVLVVAVTAVLDKEVRTCDRTSSMRSPSLSSISSTIYGVSRSAP